MARHVPVKALQSVLAFMLASAGVTAVHAQRVQVESAVVESVSGATSAISRSNGSVDTFFTMQKKMVYDTLVGLGIPLSSLPPDVRARLAQFETRNFEAFRAFCVGLNAQDEGRFADAKAAFRRALELDPSFGLAKAKESAMPQSDAVNAVQMQAVLRDAAKNATQAGKESVAVDVAHAMAAMMSGMNVVVGQAPVAAPTQNQAITDSISNPPGSSDKYGTRTAVGISYTVNVGGTAVGVASTTDWSASQVQKNTGNQLVSVGDQANFVARVGGAAQSTDAALNGSTTLADGTAVYWGAWNSTPGASASVTESGVLKSAPQLGSTLTYMMGSSTPSMPTSGVVTLTPAGGNLSAVSGNIQADFGNRQVSINNLGFTLGAYAFSGLNGQASYAATSGSGYFSGNYSSGSCTGCSAFSPTASAFTGNFVGKAANGLILSNILQTGPTTGTVSGVHLFSR